jgi:hypothetical protein
MDFERSVFINCPFDRKYENLLRPMIFALIYMGLNPSLSSEGTDCSEDRLDKIMMLIKKSKFSIHDISYMKAQKPGELFRMNMPFELGIDYGVKKCGSKKEFKSKQMLILESKRYQYKKALSDFSGKDIYYHNNEPQKLISIIRDWFIERIGEDFNCSYADIWYKYSEFSGHVWDVMDKRGKRGLACNKMPIPEYKSHAKKWVANNVQHIKS